MANTSVNKLWRRDEVGGVRTLGANKPKKVVRQSAAKPIAKPPKKFTKSKFRNDLLRGKTTGPQPPARRAVVGR